MGSISDQAFKSTIFSYIGVLLGFLTVGYLFPRLLEPGQVGVIRLILNYSEIAAKIAALGTGTIVIRYFAKFENKQLKHNGFLTYMLLVNIFGITLFLLAYDIFNGYIIEKNISQSPLFAQYFYWIVPVTISLVFFNLLDTYSTALKMSTIGIIFKDFFQRILIVILLLSVWATYVPFETTISIYFSIVISITILLLIYLFATKKIVFGTFTNFLTKKLFKEMSTVASFALLTGIGGTTVVYVDNIMINEYMGEAETGIYSTVFLYTALIMVPTRGLGKIAGAYVADSFQKNNLEKVKSIYYKSCMNQFLPGLLIFIFLWTNSDLIFHILPKEYSTGKFLIIILGLGNLFNAITGVNTQVIAYSPLHKFNTVFIIGLLVVTIVSNMVFIPIFGITGAAIATSISLFTFNTAKYLLLWIKYNFQPFSNKLVILIFIGSVSIFISHFINLNNVWLQSILRTLTSGSLFLIPVYLFKVSPDINEFALKFIQKYFPKRD